MHGDILYKAEDFVFSYRVGGILIQDGKILLQKPLNDDYSIIGGHVAAMETTAETLKREFAEELHAEIRVGELMAVGEIFFPWGSRPCHQISLYYRVELTDPTAIPLNGSFFGYDDLDHERINLEYCWVPLEELSNIVIYPKELVGHILSGSEQVYHFVSDQLAGGA
ncbi:MAG: NUDIX domain-containing protein [Oscillospiraceae bacterium]|nr:NUDIX domain-containing protein [Oscillospiraceae bacterium]MBQ7001106.1 NUDIX domain-containing protein [Oscillospiraceae bacterium]